jgi:hypothetical protein
MKPTLPHLIGKLAECKRSVKIGGKYCHYKNPDLVYTVKDLAILVGNNRESVHVVYESDYEPRVV